MKEEETRLRVISAQEALPVIATWNTLLDCQTLRSQKKMTNDFPALTAISNIWNRKHSEAICTSLPTDVFLLFFNRCSCLLRLGISRFWRSVLQDLTKSKTVKPATERDPSSLLLVSAPHYHHHHLHFHHSPPTQKLDDMVTAAELPCLFMGRRRPWRNDAAALITRRAPVCPPPPPSPSTPTAHPGDDHTHRGWWGNACLSGEDCRMDAASEPFLVWRPIRARQETFHFITYNFAAF